MSDDQIGDDGSQNEYGISTYALSLALLAFFSTTLDDFCVLIIFFSRALQEEENAADTSNLNWKFLKISLGQTIGFTIIVAISLIGLVLGLFLPEDYIALIGFVPILIGTWKLYEVVDEDCCNYAIYKFCCCVNEVEGDGEKEVLIPKDGGKDSEETDKEWVKDNEEESDERVQFKEDEFRIISTPNNSRKHSMAASDDISRGRSKSGVEGMEGMELQSVEDSSCPCLASCINNLFQACCDTLTSEVILYSLMFGVDNIAIYICLFATLTTVEVAVVIVIFYSLLFIYILLALVILYQCPIVAKAISENAKYLVPFILIGLGIFILSDSVIWGM